MLIACAAQVYTLTAQIRSLNHEIRSARVSSIDSPQSSTNSTLGSNLERKRGLITVLRNVIVLSILLALSCLGYVASCIVGQLASNQTLIFRRYKGPLAHLYVVLFAYGTISLVFVLLILKQTFDPTVLAQKSSSQARRSSQTPTSPTSPGSTYTRKLLSPGYSELYGGSKLAGSGFRDSYEMSSQPSSSSPRTDRCDQSPEEWRGARGAGLVTIQLESATEERRVAHKV